MSSVAILPSPLGHLSIKGTEDGIEEITYDEEIAATDHPPKCLQECCAQLNEYFKKERRVFDLKLNPQGTTFQKEVWKMLETIPYGKTISYKEEAIRMNNLKAIRAIAAANGKNPLPIVVPCHRVIG